MFPRVFTLLAADSTVTGIIGASPVRAYRHGSAPQNVVAPYVTWFVVSGVPENQLSGTPPTDRYTVQVDCWSNNTGTGATEVEELAAAVRDAIEPSGYMTGIVANNRDPDTQRYRIGMQFDIWQDRQSSS